MNYAAAASGGGETSSLLKHLPGLHVASKVAVQIVYSPFVMKFSVHLHPISK